MTAPAVESLRHVRRMYPFTMRPVHHEDLIVVENMIVAVDALHQPTPTDPLECRSCFYVWPCPTARLIHPETEGS